MDAITNSMSITSLINDNNIAWSASVHVVIEIASNFVRKAFRKILQQARNVKATDREM